MEKEEVNLEARPSGQLLDKITPKLKKITEINWKKEETINLPRFKKKRSDNNSGSVKDPN